MPHILALFGTRSGSEKRKCPQAMLITPSPRTYRRIELRGRRGSCPNHLPSMLFRDNPPHAARLPHRVGINPVSRVGSYRSEMIIRLGLIEIAWIKAKAIGRPQFPMVDVTYMKATARTAARDDVVMVHVGRQQFGGRDRDRHCRHASSGHHPHYNR
jgi:hypothetical protein